MLRHAVVLCAGASSARATGAATQPRLCAPGGRSSAPATLQRSNSAPNPAALMQRGSMDLFTLSDNSQCTENDRSETPAPAPLSQPGRISVGQGQTQLQCEQQCVQATVTPVPASVPAAAPQEKHAEGIAVMRAGQMFLKVWLLVLQGQVSECECLHQAIHYASTSCYFCCKVYG